MTRCLVFETVPGRRINFEDRIVDPSEVARRDPEVVFASWCGKKVKIPEIRRRTGWNTVSAVAHDRIYELKSTYILQAGAGEPHRRRAPDARHLKSRTRP